MRSCNPAAACFLLLGIVPLSGCRTVPSSPAPSAPIHFSLRWQSSAAATAAAVDSLTVEVLNSGGAVLLPESPAVIHPGNPPTFSDTLQVPLGAGRQVRVRAYSHGDEFFRGSASGVNVTGAQPVQVEIPMANSIQFSLRAAASVPALGDTAEVTCSLAGFAPLRAVQADFAYDPQALSLVEARASLAWSGGFDGRELAPGRGRILFYPEARGQLMGPGGAGQALCVLRFVRCPGGACPGSNARVSFSALQAVSRHNLSQPADTAGTVVGLQ